MLPEQFGKRLRLLRAMESLTQADLAEAVGVSQEYIGRLERGTASPSFPLLGKLARALRTEPANLFLFNATDTVQAMNPGFLDFADQGPALPCSGLKLGWWHRAVNWRNACCSDSLLALLGHGPGKVRFGRSLFHRHVHPEDRDLVFATDAAMGLSRKSCSLMFRLVRRDKAERWAIAWMEAMPSNGGCDDTVHGVLLDITAQAKRETFLSGLQQELEARIENKTRHLSKTILILGQEINERKEAQTERDRLNKRLQALWNVAKSSEAGLRAGNEQMLRELVALTDNRYAFMGFIDSTRSHMDVYAWSQDARADCRVTDSPKHFPLSKAGIWSQVVRTGEPLIINDFKTVLPGMRGLPKGHVPIHRLLCVPVLRSRKVVALAAVANKASPYNQEDVQQIEAFVSNILAMIERRRAEEELRRIEWLLTGQVRSGDERGRGEPEYGDLGESNTSRLILDSVGKEVLLDISRDFLDLLGTSCAVYEKNGEYALGIFNSHWCRSLDTASRNLCGCMDNAGAFASGKWLCHESRWNRAVRPCIETGKPVDTECAGGLRILAMPIKAGNEVVGAVNFGYGSPPADQDGLDRVARDFGLPAAQLADLAASCETRPPFIIETAKLRLATAARLMGEMVERKRYADALARAKLTAEQANVAKSEFLANMSHEIRTPLSGLLGMLQLLSTTETDHEQQEYVDAAGKAGEKLLAIINDILDISRVEAGRVELQPRSFSLPQLVQSVMDLFKQETVSQGLVLSWSLEPGTPSLFKGDDGKLRQILVNLVGNAVKFTAQGSVTVHATCAELPDPGAVKLVVEVQDTGIGIPADKLDTIFEPFSRVEGTFRRNHPGTGLGLSIVKRLVHLMGGSVTAESKAGQGASFIFDVRLSKSCGPSQAGGDGNSALDEETGKRRRVLLVEDDPTSRKLVQCLLEKRGHHVTALDTGQEILAALAGGKYDVVLLDIQLPYMDGLQILRLIRTDASGEFPPQIPVVALTAMAMKGDRERFLDLGMTDYLAKPLCIEDLYRVVESAEPTPRA